MPGALPQLPDKLQHLSPSEQKLIFGRDAKTGAWVVPSIEKYNEVMGTTLEAANVGDKTSGHTGSLDDLVHEEPGGPQPAPRKTRTPPPPPPPSRQTEETGAISLEDIMKHMDKQAAGGEPMPGHDPYQRPDMPEYTPGDFEGDVPQPDFMGEDEMQEYAQRRAGLRYDPQIEQLERSLEEIMVEGESHRGELDQAYQRALQDLESQTRTEQQRTAESARRRGIYDSGMAADLSARISHQGQQHGFQIAEEQARVLADLAEYLHLQKRHTREEIQSIMGQKAEEAEAMLFEMQRDQQTRRDQLAQQEFQNWLAEQAHHLEQERHLMDQYWQEVGFDADMHHRDWERDMTEWQAQEAARRGDAEQAMREMEMAHGFEHTDWQRGFQESQAAIDEYWREQEFDYGVSRDEAADARWGQEFDAQQKQMAFDRIMTMNRFEAEQEIQRMMMNNEISQQEFDNIMRLDEFDMKRKVYEWQYQ